MKIVEFNQISIPVTQIIGVSKVKFLGKGYSFWVDVPGNRYMQAFKDSKTAERERKKVIKILSGNENEIGNEKK